MRPIKFRAWDVISSTMQDWNNLKKRDFRIFENEYLMQFTGLKDKNGKEIYEGDILQLTTKQPYLYSTVVWNNETASFVGDAGDHLFGAQLTEAVGNIYENPELLRETK